MRKIYKEYEMFRKKGYLPKISKFFPTVTYVDIQTKIKVNISTSIVFI